jgi:hypothetical protein
MTAADGDRRPIRHRRGECIPPPGPRDAGGGEHGRSGTPRGGVGDELSRRGPPPRAVAFAGGAASIAAPDVPGRRRTRGRRGAEDRRPRSSTNIRPPVSSARAAPRRRRSPVHPDRPGDRVGRVVAAIPGPDGPGIPTPAPPPPRGWPPRPHRTTATPSSSSRAVVAVGGGRATTAIVVRDTAIPEAPHRSRRAASGGGSGRRDGPPRSSPVVSALVE